MAPLGIHQHDICRQRITFPFVPDTLDAPLLIGAAPCFQHQPFDQAALTALRAGMTVLPDRQRAALPNNRKADDQAI